MNSAETALIEKGWSILVEQLGVQEATRFAMLLDRRTGTALQLLRMLSSERPNRTMSDSRMALFSTSIAD